MEPNRLLIVEIMMRHLLLISLLLFPVITLADGGSPWCIVTDEIEKCRYDTADQCYSAVIDSGGTCRENARLFGTRGGQKYCVVSATGRKCNYRSQRTCLNVARAMDGGCVENTEQALRAASLTGLSKDSAGEFTAELDAAAISAGATAAGAPPSVEQVGAQ